MNKAITFSIFFYKYSPLVSDKNIRVYKTTFSSSSSPVKGAIPKIWSIAVSIGTTSGTVIMILHKEAAVLSLQAKSSEFSNTCFKAILLLIKY